MVLGNGLSNEIRCADKKCNKPLPIKDGAVGRQAHIFRRCSECCKLTCLDCNAQHEGQNCENYKATLNAQERTRCTEANTRDATAGPSRDGHVSEDTVVPVDFKPGEEYLCNVNECCFSVTLYEGSTKFWCPLCDSRHRIEGNKLIRATKRPVFPIL